MKKLFLILLVTGFAISANAQFSAGIKAGINVNKFVTSAAELSNPDVTYNPVAGAFLRFKVQSFSITPEAIFSPKNSGFQNPSNNLNINYTVSYLDVPVMLGFHMLAFNVQTGPVFGFLMNQKIDIKDVSNTYSSSLDAGVFNELNFGWQAGVGVDLFKFMLNIRYEFSMQPVMGDIVVPNKNITLKPDGRNSNFQFTLGYKLIKK